MNLIPRSFFFDDDIDNLFAPSLKKNESLMGKILDDVFIIGYDEDSYMYVARSYAYAPDEIDGCIYVAAKDELKLGQRIKVKVLDFDEYTLTGEEYVSK